MKSAHLALLLIAAGCDDQAPAGPKYYERVIQPILTQNCVRGAAQGACHKDDGGGNALGNLDLTSYGALDKRRDVLRRFGAYPVPLLLLKASGAQVPAIPYQGAGETKLFKSEIDHAGSATLSPNSAAYLELQRWLDSGAQEDGSPRMQTALSGTGPCRKDFAQVRPDVAARLGSVDTSSKAFQDFASKVEPVITQSCAVATCHSNELSDFFLTCKGSGSDDATKFNFLEAQAFVNTPADASLLVTKPLSPQVGGVPHSGGTFFQSKDDANWKALSEFAIAVGAAQSSVTQTAGQQFFDRAVMPVLLKRGCSLEACHSPGAANDFKLRSGYPGGFFSRYALDFNYREARENFLVADVPDVRHTRLVKKPIINYLEGGIGIVHRGGPPLQSSADPPGLDPRMCPQPWSEASTPFCTFVEWHRIEREELLSAGKAEPLAQGTRMRLVVVVRPPDGDRSIDFDSYRAGADLILGSIALGPLGAVDATSAQSEGSLLANCPGSARDVRHPAVNFDATKVAFALRTAQADSLDLYEVDLASRGCTKLTDGNGREQNGLRIHNLDPLYMPDGSIVFASTRGRSGPTRSPKYLLPQTDLWRMRPNGMGGYGAPEQMTALLGSELNPQLMLNGQITFTAEKASADFYQLSGRRINWDLTDYHPLLAQRAQSPGLDGNMHPSVGYSQATDIRETIDRNFILILSDDGAKGGGGALGIFNRSVGPFQADRNEITFLRSMTIIDGAATGRAGATRGAYRSPLQLPDGKYLVSYAPDVTDLAAATAVRYDLVVIDQAGTRTPLANFAGGAQSRVEAQLVYKREPRAGFVNTTQLVFGGHQDTTDPSHGVVHYPDLPLLGTLLGANLRSGRFVDRMRPAQRVVIWEDQAPPSDLAAAMAARTGTQMVVQNRKQLGAVDLASDGSVQLRLPALTPLVIELLDGNGSSLFVMTEEDQLGPGERISRGVPQEVFDSVCGGCHGSVSGRELDIAIVPDALTQASVSLSRDPSNAQSVGP